MNATEILRNIVVFDKLPGCAQVVDGGWVGQMQETKFDTFWYRGQSVTSGQTLLAVISTFYSPIMDYIFGEPIAETGHAFCSYKLFRVDE